MNLIEIQENLKDLPIQAIMGYANGQNPEVPPYMALSELSRRKAMENRATQAPTQSVKEQLESEMSGLPSVMPPPVSQGMPPQGMPPQGLPAGMPPQRPPLPQQMPQQMPPQGMPRPPMQAMPQMAPPRMAAGGLTNIPMNRDIFKYAPGGIVAFAEGELVPGGGGEMGEGTAGEAEARANMGGEGPPITARMPGAAPTSALQGSLAPAVAMLQKIMAGGDQGPPVETKADIRTKLAEKALADGKPEMAKAITQMPGEALSALVAKLQAQNEASKAQFQEGEGKMGLAALSNALIAAGEATRGQKGLGLGEAFGGFGKSYNAATADEIKRKQAQSALERSQDIETAKLQAEIENLRAAYASGDVNEIQEAQKRVQEQRLKVQANQTGAAKELIGAANAEAQMQGTLAHYKKLEEQARLNYEEKVRHDASQAEIEKARLGFQRATKNAELALRAEQMEQLAGTKLTAEDKIANNVERNLLRPTSDYALALKAYSALPADKVDSQEGKFYKARLNQLRKEAYERVKLPVPPESILPKYEDFATPPAKEEPGFFESLFGGSKPTVAKPSNAVRFEDLPKQ
jgi:hypothetical protein